LPLLIRTWNLFHGNAEPPERDAFLEQMVSLAAQDEPDLVCLQEVPAWALPRLPEWSGMQAVGAVAQPPRLGPLPIPATAGRAVTSLNHGFFRSAVAGQANAVLISPSARVLESTSLTLNAGGFRETQARSLELGLVARLAWAKERRVVQVVRSELPDAGTVTVGNLHATSFPADRRLADAELLRAAVFADGHARPDELCVVAGDFNVPAGQSSSQRELTDGDWGFSAACRKGIDQILVRGAAIAEAERWPRARRTVDGRVLSDHAPVDARIG
jgi:endonuclease/exonuclease/phosphatase family metal-dependent hydrolase